jgi:hypothetical protein
MCQVINAAMTNGGESSLRRDGLTGHNPTRTPIEVVPPAASPARLE